MKIEMESLNLEDLDVELLEQRLEMAPIGGGCSTNCTSNTGCGTDCGLNATCGSNCNGDLSWAC
jgi:hypothetical protein